VQSGAQETDEMKQSGYAQSKRASISGNGIKSDEKRIGVHCVAGLGRAPFLVAIALVNNGCSPFNAIDLIRKNRPGALNLT
jgi:hypothetical protein